MSRVRKQEQIIGAIEKQTSDSAEERSRGKSEIQRISKQRWYPDALVKVATQKTSNGQRIRIPVAILALCLLDELLKPPSRHFNDAKRKHILRRLRNREDVEESSQLKSVLKKIIEKYIESNERGDINREQRMQPGEGSNGGNIDVSRTSAEAFKSSTDVLKAVIEDNREANRVNTESMKAVIEANTASYNASTNAMMTAIESNTAIMRESVSQQRALLEMIRTMTNKLTNRFRRIEERLPVEENQEQALSPMHQNYWT